MQAELQELIENLNMTGRIHLVGHLNQHELARLLPHCITLSPLTGMALIECALGGSPIVAFDRDWQSEFVEDGVSGFVVPFTDHAAMAARAVELINDADLRRVMGGRGRERALDFSDQERIRAQEHAVFHKLLAHEGTPASR
jgi:glycosyltransferase involved in cell wall biosynthesis